MAMTPQERRALVGCTFAAACICFAPAEFRTGGFLLFLTAAQLVRHHVLSKRERAARAGAPAPAGAGPDHLGT